MYFATEGWNVVATMRDPSAASELGDLPSVLIARLDVQDNGSIQAAVEAGIARFGSLDAVVNNAGYGQFGLFEAISDSQAKAQFDVNVFGVMNVLRAVLPHFRRQRSGVVTNVSSGAGLFTLPMISLYCASKFALEGFTEALSYELLSQNIRTKLVIPHGGVTETAFSERQAAAAARGAAFEDYGDFVSEVEQAFAKMTAARTISAEEVAGVIFDATTDGTERLRYLIGDDARGFVRARRTLSDDDYVAFMRSHFAKQERS